VQGNEECGRVCACIKCFIAYLKKFGGKRKHMVSLAHEPSLRRFSGSPPFHARKVAFPPATELHMPEVPKPQPTSPMSELAPCPYPRKYSLCPRKFVCMPAFIDLKYRIFGECNDM
jgi:hypothetical protein